MAETYGWTFEAIDEMSFEQIDSACRGGKRTTRIPIRSPEEAKAIARDWRKYYGV